MVETDEYNSKLSFEKHYSYSLNQINLIWVFDPVIIWLPLHDRIPQGI